MNYYRDEEAGAAYFELANKTNNNRMIYNDIVYQACIVCNAILTNLISKPLTFDSDAHIYNFEKIS